MPGEIENTIGSIGVLIQLIWFEFPDNLVIDWNGCTVMIPDKLLLQLEVDVIIKGKEPLTVGVPVIIPVTGSKLTPDGKSPVNFSISVEGVITYLIGDGNELPIHNVVFEFPKTKLTVAF